MNVSRQHSRWQKRIRLKVERYDIRTQYANALRDEMTYRPSKLYKPNGERECLRRVRQNAVFRQYKSHQFIHVRPRHIFDVAA